MMEKIKTEKRNPVYASWRDYLRDAEGRIDVIRSWADTRGDVAVAIMFGSKMIATSILAVAKAQAEHNEILRQAQRREDGS